MHKNFMNLSINFVMDLYRAKVRAERSEDKKTIDSLMEHYPELFTSEFGDFINDYKLALTYLSQREDQNLTNLFEPMEEGGGVLH